MHTTPAMWLLHSPSQTRLYSRQLTSFWPLPFIEQDRSFRGLQPSRRIKTKCSGGSRSVNSMNGPCEAFCASCFAWRSRFSHDYSWQLFRDTTQIWIYLAVLCTRNCQSCGEAITSQSGGTLEYIVPRSRSGPETFSNRVLVHQSCHGLIHAQRLEAA